MSGIQQLASRPLVQIPSPMNHKGEMSNTEYSPSSFDDERSLRTPHSTETPGMEPEFPVLTRGYCTDDFANEGSLGVHERADDAPSQWACFRSCRSAWFVSCMRRLLTAAKKTVNCFRHTLRQTWAVVQWPSSISQKLLLRYSRKCARSIVTYPRFCCRAASVTGCLFLSVLLTALYLTFFRDTEKPKPLARSSEYLADIHMADITEWLQVPTLAGSALLQPQRSPLRRRSEDLLRQFGPERRITSILIVRNDATPDHNGGKLGKSLEDKGYLKGEQSEEVHPITDSKPSGIRTTGKTERQWQEPFEADRGCRNDRGLLERDPLFSVWHFTKGIEAVAYHGYTWKDVCRAVSTDTAVGMPVKLFGWPLLFCEPRVCFAGLP